MVVGCADPNASSNTMSATKNWGADTPHPNCGWTENARVVPAPISAELEPAISVVVRIVDNPTTPRLSIGRSVNRWRKRLVGAVPMTRLNRVVNGDDNG